MHKLVEMNKYEDEFDDNNEKDFEENGVDVLSGKCRQCFIIIFKFFNIFFSLYFLFNIRID